MHPYLSLRLPTICLALALVIWTCAGWSLAAQSGSAEPAAQSAHKQAKTPENGSGDPVPATDADGKAVVPQITEEITVTATVKPELPVSSTSRIDRRLIDCDLLSPAEIAWVDAYHARLAPLLGHLLDDAEKAWLAAATQPLQAPVT